MSSILARAPRLISCLISCLVSFAGNWAVATTVDPLYPFRPVRRAERRSRRPWRRRTQVGLFDKLKERLAPSGTGPQAGFAQGGYAPGGAGFGGPTRGGGAQDPDE